ncbi:MAG: serine/threonine-protein kinase, partial [Acidobacteriota bacterium]
ETLWQRAMERPSMERLAFVEAECGGDAAVRDEVLELLAAGAGDGGLEAIVGDCWASLVDEIATDAGFGADLDGGADAAVQPGESFGYIKVQEPLGEGGMGRVYRGVDERLGRQVALKVLRPEWASDPRMVNRLEREARLLSQLEHPMICRLYDVVKAESATGLVLELVDGEPLKDVVAGGIARAQALAWGEGLAGALAEAHAAGIVHRDLKPANIMRTTAGDLKILDFGIARSVSPSIDKPDADIHDLGVVSVGGFGEETESGHISGTMAYMSPEQFRGDPPSPATDVFALGLVLFECVAGRPAYSRETLGDGFRRAVLSGDVPPLPDAVGDGDGLAALIRRMTAKAPGARPSSADVVERLRDIRAAPARRRARRLRLAAVCVLVLFAVTMAWQARRVAQEAARANQALEQSRLEAARANREAETAEQVVDMLVGVLDMADPWVPGHQNLVARKVAAAEALEEGWRELKAAPAVTSPSRARLLAEVASVAYSLDLYDLGQEAAEEALDLSVRFFGPEDPDVADTLALLADGDFYAGRLDAGMVKIHRAARIVAQTPDPDPDLETFVLNVTSRLTLDLGLYAEAVEANRRMLEIAEETWGVDSVEALDARFAKGVTTASMAHFHRDPAALASAKTILEGTLQPTIDAFGADHPATALALIHLAAVAHQQGDLKTAESDARRAVAAMAARLGESSVDTLIVRTRLGHILLDAGDFAEARAIFADAVSKIEAEMGPESLDMLSALRGLALAHLEVGDRRASLEVVERALALAAATFGEDHWEYRELEINRALARAAAGRVDAAEAEIHRVRAANGDPYSAYIEHHALNALATIGRPAADGDPTEAG